MNLCRMSLIQLALFSGSFLALAMVFPAESTSQDSSSDSAPIALSDDLLKIANANSRESAIKLFKAHCYSCHNAKYQESELDLESLFKRWPLVKQRQTWINVLEQTRNHVMPPKDDSELSNQDRRQMVAFLHKEINHFDYSKVDHPGFEPSRRLTNREYQNTIRDLFNIELNVTQGMPDDLRGESGFDNSADTLFIQTLLMERYLQKAELVANHVVSEFKKDRRKTGRYFRVTPTSTVSARSATEKNLRAFLPRVFRRSVSEGELKQYLQIFQSAYIKSRDFESASMAVIQTALSSPSFLIKTEAAVSDRVTQKIGGYDLANRLSFFIWGSMPDDELFELARQNQLSDPKIFDAQVQRMLKERRSRSLGNDFASQWFSFHYIGKQIRADPIDNPWCTDTLMESMKQESILFFHSLVRDDRPLSDLINADYTYMNEELAKHYRIRNVKGERMRKVRLNSQRRGGVLGHASVLAVTSLPGRTSPVKRGTWILTEILGTPPPPPPPGASVFDEEIEENDRLDLRAKLKLHSKQANCKTCHQQIDPLGFSLEHYDWFGRYRSRVDGRRIDSKGQMPDGKKFSGLSGLKQVIADEKMELVATNATRKLLTYALGRQLEYYDEKAVIRIVSVARKDDYRLQTIIREITKSYPFRYRRRSEAESHPSKSKGAPQ